MEHKHIINLNSFLGRLSRDRKRVGRGIGSGKGGTSGAGHKGQCARSGTSMKRRHAEFARRLPKVGFRSNKPDLCVITLRKLYELIESGKLDPKKPIMINDLRELGFDTKYGLKVIGVVEDMKPINIQVTKISKGADECLKKFGGKVEVRTN